jgi:ATP citrate (pro-S)-lyase
MDNLLLLSLSDRKMARKKIREFAAKNLLKRFIAQYNPKFDYTKLPLFLLTNDTNFRHLKQTTPGLDSEKFVVKPDMLFGARPTFGPVRNSV